MSHDLPPSAVEVFELMGAYIVDTLCNHHYELATQHHRDGKAHTITAAYVDILRSYAFAITKRKEVYQTFVTQLRNFYNKSSRFEYTIARFEERILSQFIPPEYFSQFTNVDKEKAMCQILTTAVSELCLFAQSREMLANIIDRRDHAESNRTTVVLMQDRIKDSLSRQRDEFYTKFAAQIVKRASGGGVDHEVYNKLVTEFRSEKKKRIESDVAREKLEKMVKLLDAECSQLRRENEQIRAEIMAQRKAPTDVPREKLRPTPPTPTPAPIPPPEGDDDAENQGDTNEHVDGGSNDILDGAQDDTDSFWS